MASGSYKVGSETSEGGADAVVDGTIRRMPSNSSCCFLSKGTSYTDARQRPYHLEVAESPVLLQTQGNVRIIFSLNSSRKVRI